MFEINGTTITLTRGDSAYFYVEPTLDGETIVMTDGDKMFLTVKKNHEDAEPLFQCVSTDGHFRIAPEDTSGLSFEKYVYDVQLNYGDDVYTVVGPGKFVIDKEVTF